jgi:hypothetical protein
MEADVDLAAMYSGLPGASALAGLSDAWYWATAPGFDSAAALSEDGEHAFECFAVDSYDEGLVTAVLAFAREHADALLAPPDRPLVVAEGFSHPGFKFDTVVVFGPAVHTYYEETPDVHQAVRAAQPAFRCEFAGDENAEDARYRYIRASGVRPTSLDREPRPYMKLRHKTDTRVLPERTFLSFAALVNELRAMADRPDKFVEYENYRHEVKRIEWSDDQWGITGDAISPLHLGIDATLDWVKADLWGPNLDAGTSRFPA